MNSFIKRRDRMIAAFKEMISHTQRLSGKNYSTCGTCGAMIEWVTTASGKKQACIPNMGEPHIPHCGKQHWPIEKWEEVLKGYIKKEEIENRIPVITIPDGDGIKTIEGKEARKILKTWKNTPNTNNSLPWE